MPGSVWKGRRLSMRERSLRPCENGLYDHFPLDRVLHAPRPHVGSASGTPSYGPLEAGRRTWRCSSRKMPFPRRSPLGVPLRRLRKSGVESCTYVEGRFAMQTSPHIRHWAQGGPTTLSNLALLCRRHHRAVHEEGYQLDRRPDGELRIRDPHGWVLPEVPPPPEVLGDPVKILAERNEADGLSLNAHTATPGWLGERLNVGWAIDVLHPLARQPTAAAVPAIEIQSAPLADREGLA